MTVRELIKALEACDIDKDITILVSVTSEDENGYNVLLRQVIDVIENIDVVTIR